MLKIKRLLTFMLAIFVLTISCLAHSGRTDANGGHKDNNNKSGLGSYHYHCGGHPAHLHKNGICPYAVKETTQATTTVSSPVSTPKASNKIGEVKYTDIVTYINGSAIQSYNIDNKTAVVAEDLAYYGYSVVWNSLDRTLSLKRDGSINSQNYVPDNSKKYKIGDYLMDVLFTDIVTYLNENIITSYNIGGRTIVFVDDLIEPNDSYIYNNDKRILTLDFN